MNDEEFHQKLWPLIDYFKKQYPMQMGIGDELADIKHELCRRMNIDWDGNPVTQDNSQKTPHE